MDYKTYKKNTEKFFLEKKVRTSIKMENGLMVIPKDTICQITRKYQGFSLRSSPCVTCGIQIHITRVHCKDVELIDQT